MLHLLCLCKQRLTVVYQRYLKNRLFALALLSLFFLSLVIIIAQIRKTQDYPRQIKEEAPTFPKKLVTPQQPAGIFAFVAINNPEKDYNPEEVEKIRQNPAVAGIALKERWENLEPQEDVFDFSRTDDVINSVFRYNKKVQLILVPGFFTPQWVLDKIPSCDGFLTPACGKATFTVSYGPNSKEAKELPLPWNSTYKQAWQKFIREVARRYNANSTVISITVAGPTSVSAEMSLPNETQDERDKWKKILELFYPLGDPHRESNLVVIKEWQEMINFYGKTFHNKTIVVTSGAGLLKFKPGDPQKAKDQILNFFVQTPLGSNLKANQTSGMKACRNFQGGIGQVKELTRQGVIGGAQFNSSATKNPETMGCQDEDFCSSAEREDFCKKDNKDHPCCKLTPAEAVSNVLQVYFEDTPYGAEFNSTNGDYRMNYLQVYDQDIPNANNSAGYPGVQELFLKASRYLLLMVGMSVTPSPPNISAKLIRGIYSVIEWNKSPKNQFRCKSV